MNQPMEQPFDKLEQRVGNLEQAYDEIIKNEQLIIRLSQRHHLHTQELKAITGRIELDIEDSTERLDKIEATMATKEDIAELKATTERIKLDVGDSRERFDTIERTMATKEDVAALKGDITTLKGDITTLKGDVAALKQTQAEHGALLREILDRLPPKQA